MLLKWFKTQEDYLIFIFRILVGFMYLLHAMMKLGWLGSPAMTGFMLFIGICELLIALGIILGLFTRLAALGGAIIMLGAWFTFHIKSGWNPFANHGEPAILFFAAFLVILALGYKKWGLDGLFKKEVF